MAIPIRYLTCLTLFLCLMTCYFFRACMSVAVLTMGQESGGSSTTSTHSASGDHSNDGSCQATDVMSISSKLSFTPRLTLSSSQNYDMLSAYFYGYLVTNFPGCLLVHTIGPRITMIIALSGATFFTIINPPLTYITSYAYHLTMLCRICVGAFCGPLYASMHELLSRWAPVHERTKLTVITHSGNIFGLMLAFSSGSLVDLTEKGWEYYFYFGGALGVATLIMWVLFVYDQPWLHPRIDDKEREMIVQSLHPNGQPKPEKLSHIPFRSIFTSKHVYFIATAHMGNNLILYMFLTNHTKFLQKVFHIPAKYASLFSIIPFFVNFLCQAMTSALSIRFQRFLGRSITYFRKVNGAIAFVGGAILLSPAGFMPCSVPGFIITEILLTASMGIIAFNQLSFFTAMIDISPEHSGIIMGICNTIASISGFVSPLMVKGFVKAYTEKPGWSYAFVTTACASLACGAVWLIFGTSELQPWAAHHKEDSKSIEMTTTAKTIDSESVA